MMLAVRRGLVLVACVSAGFVISAGPGLVARAAEPDRWVSAIAAGASDARPADEAAQRRIGELEQRVKQLEAERRAQAVGTPSDLAAAIARNEELAARNRALSVENRELAESRSPAWSDTRPACQPPDDADPREQLRYWAKQIRDGEASSRRLPPDWNSAVNVLLRRERALDPHNPWSER